MGVVERTAAARVRPAPAMQSDAAEAAGGHGAGAAAAAHPPPPSRRRWLASAGDPASRAAPKRRRGGPLPAWLFHIMKFICDRFRSLNQLFFCREAVCEMAHRFEHIANCAET